MDPSNPNTYIWLILSDSALPLGSFAFSAGLESCIAHSVSKNVTARAAVLDFCALSVRSLATSTLPLIKATYEDPSSAALFDDELDASITCSVGRRASVSQGRALLAVWERSLAPSCPSDVSRALVANYKKRREMHAHFPVAWGLICRAFDLKLEDTIYVFVFNHIKTVVSAAVRLGLVGPYFAQSVLAAEQTRVWVREAVEEGGNRGRGEVGQSVPALDLWQGRHEVLYSRVFNS